MIDDASIWTALADAKRRQIITLLEEKPRTTSNLSEFFDVSRFAIMKHLKVLEQAELIEVKREGRKRWNILNQDLIHFLRSRQYDKDGPFRLMDILGLFPGQKPAAPLESGLASPICIEQAILLQAPPSQVFEVLTAGIDAWWHYRASALSRMYLEPNVNGRFYEAFDTTGQGILYGTITYIKQDEELRLKGTPELTEQVANRFVLDNFVRVTLETHNKATQLTLRHYITGAVDETTSDIFKQRWHDLLAQHLKSFVEKGIPYQQNL